MGEALQVRAIGPETLNDLRQLLVTPPHGWCWCVAWEVPTWEGWEARTEEENRDLRERLWAQGQYDGYLLYRQEEPLAWCRVGPRSRWPKLCRSFGLDPTEDVYAFTCFGIRQEAMGQGLMHTFLRLVLADLRRRGVRAVEAFPRKLEGQVEPGELWMGPASLFDRAGFVTVRETDRWRHVGLELAPAALTPPAGAAGPPEVSPPG
ncbi:GNAT family N-acetyltransferase [Limnochorda pilosa]|uniref:N-acetyltransferase domain-containing protein n=1 Tax=Limnochorda pilosa TaxID=1555112 RepID=A0A0K2SK82_LIMPI|nr:hypothetical protein [Limnochorda pilosa]BAS27427.1 hypothetical protein LIP_1580 [Limnochorda pilosa]